MVINHLQGNSTKASSYGNKNRSQKSDKKSDSFEDMLGRSITSKKKKSAAKKAAPKRPVSKRKTSDINDNEQAQRKANRPTPKKVVAGQNKPINKVRDPKKQGLQKPLQQQGPAQLKVQQGEVKNPQMQLLQAEQERSLQMDVAGKKVDKDIALFEKSGNLKEGPAGKTQGIALSKDSSETLEKTLTANEQKLVQDLNAKQLKRETNIFQPNAQAKKLQGVNAMKSSDIKIDPKPGNSSSQNSELMENLETLKSKLTDLSSDNKNLSQENSTGLDKGFTPAGEVDINVDQVNKSFFAEKLAEVDGGAQKADKIENMDSIIKQARTFIKDGGGEMQIELAPEGLGKIQLKVAVENGRAQVEMFADNKLAKAALEESIGEMKIGLESQRLVVDHLKVEMSNDYEKDFSQLKDNMMEQEQREFARQFLNQFRDEKNERWDGMFSGFKNYARTGAKPELGLQPNTQPAMMAKNKGRSLNVVA